MKLPRLLELSLPLRSALVSAVAGWKARNDESRPLSTTRIAGVTIAAAFGDSMSSSEIRKMARRCVRARALVRLDHADLLRGGVAQRVIHTGPLLELRRRGQGALVCGIHLGPYHYVALQLIAMGFHVVAIASDDVKDRFDESWRNVVAGLPGEFEAFPAQNPQSLLKLIRAVRRGAVAVVYLDGQTGAGGPGGGMHHQKVFEFLSMPIRARTGSTYLAHRAAVPTVLGAACRDASGRRVVEFSNQYPPPPRDAADGPDQLLSAIAPWFEQRIREHPEQWVGWLLPVLTWGSTGTSPTATHDEIAHTRSRVRSLLDDRTGRARLVADPVRVGVVEYANERLIVEGRRRLILSVSPLSARVLQLAQRRERLARLPARTGARRHDLELEVTRMVLAGIATLEGAAGP